MKKNKADRSGRPVTEEKRSGLSCCASLCISATNQKKASTRANTVFCFRSVEMSLPSKYSKVATTFLRTVARTPSCQPFCPVKMALYVGNMIP